MSQRGGIRSGWMRPTSDFHGGTRAPEAQIRVTFNIANRSEIAMRAVIESMTNANDATVIGYSYIGGRYGSIDPKDIAFAYEHQTRQGPKTDANMEVFSAFNGEIVPPRITQEQFNSRYKAVGVAQGGSDPEFKHGGDNSGIAIISQGATTITNNSEQTFFFGDTIRVVPPSVDQKERQRFHGAMKLATHENFIEGKHKGRIELVSYEGIMGKFDEAVAIVVTEPGSLDVPGRATALLNNAPIDDSDPQGVALCLKRLFGHIAAQTISVMQRRPNLATLTPLQASAKLGLISDTANPEDIDLQRELFGRYSVSSLGATNVYDTIAPQIERDFAGSTTQTIVTSLFAPPTTQFTPAEQVKREGEQALDLVWRSIAHLLHRHGSDAFAQCLGTSEPGGPLDVNVHAV